ncbi:hypothetical protein Agabi119p4_6804 [Agaricus bisporus var. burnettii]|uniref:Uncharacterized protein n=1 Tax=Agaricus bisporus var. burnettii TaxID=192524 RepID=A0A8H7F081_AGABI|nr:hypothetical protein Agabi119p4_6804 [Agaricus bisporus var. burnettii]
MKIFQEKRLFWAYIDFSFIQLDTILGRLSLCYWGTATGPHCSNHRSSLFQQPSDVSLAAQSPSPRLERLEVQRQPSSRRNTVLRNPWKYWWCLTIQQESLDPTSLPHSSEPARFFLFQTL